MLLWSQKPKSSRVDLFFGQQAPVRGAPLPPPHLDFRDASWQEWLLHQAVQCLFCKRSLAKGASGG